MSFRDVQNPGIGGLDELTDAETLVVQQIAALGDPNADRILFWDESSNSYAFLTAGSGLTITGTTITSSGGAGGITIATTTVTGGASGNILYNNAGVVGEYTNTGSGTVNVLQTSPTLITPVLGVATATTINGLTITSSTGTVTITNAKTLAVTNTLTFSGTDSTVMTFPTTSKTLAANDGSNWTFTSQAIGDIVYASSTTAFTRLAAVASGQVLVSAGTGTAPAYSANPSITTLELGSGGATDTTLSRAAAGDLAVEGVSVLTTSNTKTVTNKRNQPRIVSAASYTTDTGTSLDVSTCDIFIVTAQAGALKLNNPSGTPQHGEKLIVRIKDNGTARALTYDTQFRGISTTLPSTTVISKTLYMGFIYNTTDTKWDLIAVAQEA